jgi:hypothetical protein
MEQSAEMNLRFVPIPILIWDRMLKGRDERQSTAPLTPPVSAPHRKNAAQRLRTLAGGEWLVA